MRHLGWIGVVILMLFGVGFVPVRAGDATVSTCDFASLQAAITTANAGGGTIDFTCSGTITFTSTLSISDDVIINEAGQNVVFDGAGTTQLLVINGGASLILNDLTLHDGFFAGNGGAIDNAGTLTINNGTFTDHFAINGGVIVNTGILTINNSTFTNNQVSINGGTIVSNGTITINNSIFTLNLAGNGGAIANDGTITINNSIFTDNSATSGGAIYNLDTISSQDSHYENNTCTSNPITDNGGNTVINATGCPGSAPIALNVSALACVGDDAVFTINNGDGNFDVTGTGVGLPLSNIGKGIVTLTGPATWTNIIITERLGERDFINIGGIRCPEAVIIPPSEPITPTATVLGCALDTTDGVDVAGAPDNTYCRILMKNGAVISYSGAIPADLIGLGVILAVDVYRLEGGATQNTFPEYARVCLSGTGRLFYMDGRNAPRVSVEMPSESVDGLTCAWIPAPGTVILTN